MVEYKTVFNINVLIWAEKQNLWKLFRRERYFEQLYQKLDRIIAASRHIVSNGLGGCVFFFFIPTFKIFFLQLASEGRSIKEFSFPRVKMYLDFTLEKVTVCPQQ